MLMISIHSMHTDRNSPTVYSAHEEGAHNSHGHIDPHGHEVPTVYTIPTVSMKRGGRPRRGLRGRQGSIKDAFKNFIS